MLNNILYISGKPGLYRLISRGKNMLICESLIDGKRTPAMQNDKVLSLGDIAMYGLEEEVALNSLYARAKELTGGKVAPVTVKSTEAERREWFATVFPEWDEDRIHTGDIKKFIQWFNILIETGNDDFSEEEEATEE